jgi:hypothetical protein
LRRAHHGGSLRAAATRPVLILAWQAGETQAFHGVRVGGHRAGGEPGLEGVCRMQIDQRGDGRSVARGVPRGGR